MQTTPGLRGGKQNSNCRGHLAGKSDDWALVRMSAESRDCNRGWRRSREAKMAAEARLLPRKRGKAEGAEGEKNLRGGAGFGCFRSGLITRVREEIRGREYL